MTLNLQTLPANYWCFFQAPLVFTIEATTGSSLKYEEPNILGSIFPSAFIKINPAYKIIRSCTLLVMFSYAAPSQMLTLLSSGCQGTSQHQKLPQGHLCIFTLTTATGLVANSKERTYAKLDSSPEVSILSEPLLKEPSRGICSLAPLPSLVWLWVPC